MQINLEFIFLGNPARGDIGVRQKRLGSFATFESQQRMRRDQLRKQPWFVLDKKSCCGTSVLHIAIVTLKEHVLFWWM